ncbi:hypothetical protein [Marinomonas mediterranea]|uniref:hypothetical protein n=1 Tax=Marinomonas mediterranea TaxID=119864 RepID=UPI00234B65C0|nr:hypothetical protein [Marinomonas mediterranea]WCN11087.1 hypothetical protein GV055_20190 [Marinomonas mediterranea]
MDSQNQLSNKKLFGIGVRLVRFAWIVEILAVSIGFMISMVVSFSAYTELNRNRGNDALSIGDYSSIVVAALPFVLVAVVEAAKIPLATAMMYAKHFYWRILFFLGLALLATITFETMLNGFERNFSNLNLTIDEQKNESLLIQAKIDDLEARKTEINVIDPDLVEEDYRGKVNSAHNYYLAQVNQEKERINAQLDRLSNVGTASYEQEIQTLNAKERDIYDAWDKERDDLQKRFRTLLNSYVNNTENDRAKQEKELEELKKEMDREVADASFFSRSQVEKKYRALIKEKEERLYQVTDRTTGDGALEKRTKTEKQLQDQLQLLGQDYQKRIDLVRNRITYLENQIEEQKQKNGSQKANLLASLEQSEDLAARSRSASVNRANSEKSELLSQYDVIQVEVKAIDAEVYEYKQQQTLIAHEVNRLVNSNQIYRMAAYIENKEQAIEVSKSTVGLVALVWFSSLAFISAVTGVFLAIAGLYMQRVYAKSEELQSPPPTRTEEPSPKQTEDDENAPLSIAS